MRSSREGRACFHVSDSPEVKHRQVLKCNKVLKLPAGATDCRSVRLRSRFLLNSFWRQLLTHYKARTEALYESIEKSPIDVHGSKTRGTFVAQSVGAWVGSSRGGSHSKGEPCACERQHLSLSDKAICPKIYRQRTREYTEISSAFIDLAYL